MPVQEFAAAKINLTLEIIGRRPNGYHELRSLVAFSADVGDHLAFDAGQSLSLETIGPEASSIDGSNLITSVVEGLLNEQPGMVSGAFRLTKNLPVASGIGGGSSDAAAAIRAIARANGIDDPATEFARAAAEIGADIPVCIGNRARPTAAFMSGIGECVWRPPSGTLLPPGGLSAVLVNPRVPVPTAAVFQALATRPLASAPTDDPPAPFATVDDCFAYIAASRNDLEAPAKSIAPVIAEVLGALRSLDASRLARMSGSGATCFALFGNMEDARQAAQELSEQNPKWWVAATRLQ